MYLFILFCLAWHECVSPSLTHTHIARHYSSSFDYYDNSCFSHFPHRLSPTPLCGGISRGICRQAANRHNTQGLDSSRHVASPMPHSCCSNFAQRRRRRRRLDKISAILRVCSTAALAESGFYVGYELHTLQQINRISSLDDATLFYFIGRDLFSECNE